MTTELKSWVDQQVKQSRTRSAPVWMRRVFLANSKRATPFNGMALLLEMYRSLVKDQPNEHATLPRPR